MGHNIPNNYLPLIQTSGVTRFNMKRAHSCSAIDQNDCRFSPAKRSEPSPAASDHRDSIGTHPAQGLPLTPHVVQLSSVRTSVSPDYKQRIQHWINDCDNCSREEIAPPRTPSVTSNETCRTSKLVRRQRSQSPSKRTSPQYRARNMADASIFVDHMPELLQT